MAVPANVDVAKPSSSGGGGGIGSASRMPFMPIITPPVVVVPQTTTQVAPNAPLSQTTAGAPTKTMVDNPDQDRVLGGAVVPPSSTTVEEAWQNYLEESLTLWDPTLQKMITRYYSNDKLNIKEPKK
jgi:hypothetical protein